MQLVISCANQQLDVTQYLDVTDGGGMDPANPSFTEKVFTRSLLKEGGTLALESFQLRELQFPIKLNAASQSATIQLEQQINQIVNTPGAVATWQDDGLSQATTFDLASGQLDIDYSYRAAQQKWLFGKLRLFAQPLGRTAQPRAYAAASGVGPLLMISPYASSTNLIIGASTQAGVAGYGGQQQPSGGVFYPGNPSLAGDATAMLQITYAKPPPTGALGGIATIPYMAVSVLPDQTYIPLYTASQFNTFGGAIRTEAGAVASTYARYAGASGAQSIQPDPSPQSVPVSWGGLHRVFVIARASTLPQSLTLSSTVITPYQSTATVYPGDWQLVDVGVIALRAHERLPQGIGITVGAQPASSSVVLDMTAIITLPESSTWFLNPVGVASTAIAKYTNEIYLDDYLADDQLLVAGNTASQAPSPPVISSTAASRLTPYSRGLVPRPDPKDGLPILAVLGVGQYSVASTSVGGSATWANPLNVLGTAQVAVVERTRYVLP